MFSGIFENAEGVFPVTLHFGQDKEESAAHGKMGNIDMDNRNEGDKKSASEDIELPYWIIDYIIV